MKNDTTSDSDFIDTQAFYVFDVQNKNILKSYIYIFDNGLGMVVNKAPKQNEHNEHLYFVYIVTRDKDSESSKRFKYDLYSTKFIGKYYGHEFVLELIKRIKDL